MKRKKILFICTGNTCRSPMAEALLRNEIKLNKIKYVDVASAGLKVKKGDTLNPLSEKTLQENGLSLPKKFKPKQLTDKLFSNAFVVITMTEDQLKLLPKDKKVYSMASLTGVSVPDPYGQGEEAYRHTFLLLQTCAKKIVELISNNGV